MELLICILILLWIFSPINITKVVDEEGNTTVSIKCGKKVNKDNKNH